MEQKNDSDKSPYENKIFNSFINDIKKESDRAAVIIAAAKIDLLLYQLIMKFLLPSPTSRDELLDNDAALGTFSARINFVYRAGLLTPEYVRALHILRRIRNDFAHEPSNASLNSGSHQDRIKELVTPFCKSIFFKNLRQKLFGKDDPASDFRMVIAIMALRINGAIAKCNTLNADAAFDLVPPEPEPKSIPTPVS
jgi:hypothetical protein